MLPSSSTAEGLAGLGLGQGPVQAGTLSFKSNNAAGTRALLPGTMCSILFFWGSVKATTLLAGGAASPPARSDTNLFQQNEDKTNQIMVDLGRNSFSSLQGKILSWYLD